VCGAGGVMAWERGAGKGREGAEGVDVDYALELVLDEAHRRGWTVASMKDHWRRIFAFE
jgi:hypothetical protein